MNMRGLGVVVTLLLAASALSLRAEPVAEAAPATNTAAHWESRLSKLDRQLVTMAARTPV